ncbi:DUF3906 family protein [Bacillus solimangrovi]|uniref:DUF3906 domain-containing protein n=1 Tax=Bacillus solimangrovi TaxID=1305675 RepID=A0A1E5LFA1_9BACI|nr:DUF3906 family protein [Bacillus solimangrovi]OEH92743.1 hypothetical protein BFG57_01710 [Bacillus solimangrovi]
MNLYRLRATTSAGEFNIVTAAQSEEEAFAYAEQEIEKQFLKIPEIEEIVLYEKKKINKGNAFVIQEEE